MNYLFTFLIISILQLPLYSQSCDSTTIIEFGTLDNPCVISSLVLSSRDITYDWYCDQMHIPQYNRSNMHILDNALHSYMLIVSDTFGCTDTARAILERSQCAVETGVISLLPSSEWKIVSIIDVSGRSLWHGDSEESMTTEQTLKLFPQGMYFILFENPYGEHYIKKYCGY